MNFDYPQDRIPSFSFQQHSKKIVTEYNELGFTKENIRSITAIGESTKNRIINDDLQNGEKGVGFKTVFAIASEVNIHSGDYHFSLSADEPTIPRLINGVKEPVEGTRMEITLKDQSPILSMDATILNITPVDFAGLYARFDEIREDINMMQMSALDELLPLVKCAELLARKYDVVVTNPPYMGSSGMNPLLTNYVKTNYPDSKSDLFACFIERGNHMVKKHRFNCMVTMQSWMFLSSFEKMREKVLQTKSITNLMHMENMVMGIAFGTAVTVFRNDHVTGYKGTYNQIKLQDIENGEPKSFPVSENRFAQTSTDNFSKIPGSPVAYWASLQMQNAFATAPSFPGNTKKGVLTGDNERFLRLWHEVCISKIGMTMSSHSEMVDSKKKWFPVTSGGFMRKWYGNFDTIVNLENDGFAIRSVVKNYRLREPAYYFREAVTWTEVSSGIFSCRYVPHTILFGNGGPVSFFFTDNLYYCLALLNSSATMSMLAYLAPTINYGPEQINKLPVLTERKNTVDNLSKDNVKLSQQDWDSCETSWDFKRNPLI